MDLLIVNRALPERNRVVDVAVAHSRRFRRDVRRRLSKSHGRKKQRYERLEFHVLLPSRKIFRTGSIELSCAVWRAFFFRMHHAKGQTALAGRRDSPGWRGGTIDRLASDPPDRGRLAEVHCRGTSCRPRSAIAGNRRKTKTECLRSCVSRASSSSSAAAAAQSAAQSAAKLELRQPWPCYKSACEQSRSPAATSCREDRSSAADRE